MAEPRGHRRTSTGLFSFTKSAYLGKTEWERRMGIGKLWRALDIEIVYNNNGNACCVVMVINLAGLISLLALAATTTQIYAQEPPDS